MEELTGNSQLSSLKARKAAGFRQRLLVVVGCLLLVIPVGLSVLAIVRYQPAPIVNQEVEPVATFVPEVVEQRGTQDAGLVLTWQAGESLLAPSWVGTVTGVKVRLGDTIKGFNEVVEVDGIARLAWRTASPLYRVLQSGDRGPDVTSLQKGLNSLGLLEDKPTGRMDLATVSAVEAYSKKVGFVDAQDVFDPSWVIFLPVKELIVGNVGLAVGAPAPPGGTVIVESPLSLTTAVVTAMEGSELPTEVADWEVVVGEQRYPFDDAGAIGSEHLGEIETWVRTNESNTEEPAAAVTVSIQRVQPLRVHRVPAISVSTGADARHCVWSATDEQTPDPKYEPIFVELLPDRAQSGLSLLVGLPDGLVLVSNPRTSLGFVSCP